MEISDFFTLNSLTTLGGSAMIVYVICNAIQHVFRINPKLLGFVLSILIAIIGTFSANKFTVPLLLLSLANGCLIYCTSVGMVQIIGSGDHKNTGSNLTRYKTDKETLVKKDRTFFSKWY